MKRFVHDLEVIGSRIGWVKLGVHSCSVYIGFNKLGSLSNLHFTLSDKANENVLCKKKLIIVHEE